MGVSDMASIALVFVLAGITMSIGSSILYNMGTSFDTTSVTNETQTFVNATAQELDQEPLAAVSSIKNETDVFPTDTDSGAGNAYWTTSGTGTDIQVVLYTNATYDNATQYVTYTHRNTPAYRSAHNATSGIGEISGWMGTIALVLAASVIIGVIFTSFGGLGQRR